MPIILPSDEDPNTYQSLFAVWRTWSLLHGLSFGWVVGWRRNLHLAPRIHAYKIYWRKWMRAVGSKRCSFRHLADIVAEIICGHLGDPMGMGWQCDCQEWLGDRSCQSLAVKGPFRRTIPTNFEVWTNSYEPSQNCYSRMHTVQTYILAGVYELT